MDKKETRRKWLIKLIHIAQSKLGMDKETYRTFLVNIVDKSSCSDMTISELEKVLENMKSRGFNTKTNTTKRRIGTSQQYTLSNITKKIRAKWLEMYSQGIIRNSSEDALNAYVAKIAKNKDDQPIQFVSWLDNEQATKVLERLKKWQQRELGGM
ncbi:regulatory protein GemA [Pasteurella multocida]|uniref:gp16 family protein n=1 Tax=Pasteurella multocida TaxID=747 RepID=UPI002B5F1B6D|nr:regulatory protein GemA [Pasteurella multocida]MEB3496488.1 regulatory protein GemA [Pasteurella multocida]MEB3501397.1 regulatory protein GemA [Pasteurella multocida]